MNIISNPDKFRAFEKGNKVEKITRRAVLKTLGLAGGFVLAAPVLSRQAFAAYQTGAGDMPPVPHVRRGDKVGRNAPCPCGSGKKYKKCCGVNA